jgi:hypothetical protein
VKRVLIVAASALVLAAPAAARLPVHLSGSSVGEGAPLKAYATITPTVHLFGDAVTAKIAVVADTKWVDPARVRVNASFTPYEPTRSPAVLRYSVGRFAQVTYTWKLRCISSACVPRVPPSDKFHVFRFHAARVEYLGLTGNPQYGLNVSWPAVEVLSQVSPGVTAFLRKSNNLNWRIHITPVASPTYRMSPNLLFWLSLAFAGVLAAVAAVFARRWYFVVRPRSVETYTIDPGTTLERALAVLRHAHEQGDETLQRKAFERIAGELGIEEADELTRTARELAWSPRTPEDEEVEEFAAQARGTQEADE